MWKLALAYFFFFFFFFWIDLVMHIFRNTQKKKIEVTDI